MSKFFRSVIILNPKQLIFSYYFCILKIAPDYEGNDLGVGKEILMKALASSSGREVKKIREEF
jgi:DNA ligase 1